MRLFLLSTLAGAAFAGCACSGAAPCQYKGGTECFAMQNNFGVQRCPAQTEHCSCACSGESPCEANGVCVGLTQMYGKSVCPGVGIHCVSAEAAATTFAPAVVALVAAPSCVCGGGTPCATASGGCVQMHAAASGALVCPVGAAKCDCDCAGDHPCRYTDHTGKSFCFAHTGNTLGGVTVCPSHTTRCDATAAIAVADLATITTTAAPNVQAYDPAATTAAPHPATDPNSGKKNCLFDGFSEWSTCTRKCGSGVQQRSAKVTQFPEQGGAQCPLDQTRACNEQACNNDDCKIGGWGPWSACSVNSERNGVAVSCGGGTKTRLPIITQQPIDYGAACPAPLAMPCNTGGCYDALPRCQCDPFADYDGTQTQGDDPQRPSHTYHSSTDGNAATEITCIVENGRVQVRHPQAKFLHPLTQSLSKDNAGGKHVCKHSGSQCRCCTCHQLQCHNSRWGSWSVCALANGESIPTQLRTRTMAGATVVGDQCAVATENRLCQSSSV